MISDLHVAHLADSASGLPHAYAPVKYLTLKSKLRKGGAGRALLANADWPLKGLDPGALKINT